MAALLGPTKYLQRSPYSSALTRSNLINFTGTQLRFEPIIQSKPIKWEALPSLVIRRRNEHLRKGVLGVRCTAEGIERGMLIGRRGDPAAAKVINVPERFKVVALMACVMCLCNADRVVMSVAVVPLASKLGWSSSFLGIVQVLLQSYIIYEVFIFI